jgi:predicted dehydrogenase
MKDNRRRFIKKLAGGSIALPTIISSKAAAQSIIINPQLHTLESKAYKSNDKVRLAAIGTGIIGFINIRTALKVPGVELVAACDLYDGRLTQVKAEFGNQVKTTKDYKEILAMDDVDVVLIATPDHWHDYIAIDAMENGKAVYLEKPMVHKIEEGYAIIATARKTKVPIQIGSQGVSSIVHQRAHEIYKSGAIGDLVMIDAAYDRHSTLGAWQYSIPPDASPENIDWNQFLGDAPKVAFDPVRFFRWRNYQDYGTGITGDLYVHLISWINNIVKSNGPNKVYASGGLRYWKDGRDVPDIMMALMDYPATDNHPAFNLSIRVNFVAGGQTENGLRIVGSEGSMLLKGNSIILSKTPMPKKPEYGGYDSLFTFPESTQKEFIEGYKQKYYSVSENLQEPGEVTYQAPEGYDDRYDHWVNLIAAIRDGSKIVEDASYGLRAAAPSLAANISYFEDKIVHWDPDKMKLI